MFDKLLSFFRESSSPQQLTSAPETVQNSNVLAESLEQNNVSTYLKYYCSLDAPGHAVLITGPWGVGKTYQIKRNLSETDAFYVSLFGLDSHEDVMAAVYASMFPIEATVKKQTESLKNTSLGIPGIASIPVGGMASSLVGAFLRQKVDSSKPIIFDDLERCGLNIQTTLGIINLYVEHHGCRVIVVAHDEKITSGFAQSKEKIFGQTLLVHPETDSAFSYYVSKVEQPKIREIISSHKNTIIEIFIESKCFSLRILKHLIFDLIRLLSCLSDKHIKSENALHEIIALFSAISIEWRAGRLESKDLQRRSLTLTAYSLSASKQKNASPPNIAVADERYASVDLTSRLLDDQCLLEMFSEGLYRKATITASIDASVHFLKEDLSRPWRIVASFDKLEDELVSEGLTRFLKEFEDRTVSDPGELLHIFALLLMMSKHSIRKRSIEDTVVDCLKYISDIAEAKKLPLPNSGFRWQEELADSYQGIMYWVTPDYENDFFKLRGALFQEIENALKESLPKHIPDLLELMKTDAIKFREMLCHTNTGNNKFASTPILSLIPPKKFAACWLSAPKTNWYWITATLRDRSLPMAPEDQKQEKEWKDEVLKLMEEAATDLDGLSRLRLVRAIQRCQ
jgi:hypothetical protein